MSEWELKRFVEYILNKESEWCTCAYANGAKEQYHFNMQNAFFLQQFNSIQFLEFFHTTCLEPFVVSSFPCMVTPFSITLSVCVCVKAKIGVYVPEVGMRHLLYKHLYDALEALCFPFYFTWIRHTRTKAKQSLFSQWSVGITSNFISRKTGATC